MNNKKERLVNFQFRPVNKDNWRKIAHLKVNQSQRDFVAEPCYYLALCNYGQDWNPLAIYMGDEVIGFFMWAVDPADNSCWLGGILIDLSHQGKGYGRLVVQLALSMLSGKHGFEDFALSYNPENKIARHLYQSIGFIETGEREDDEIVARLKYSG